MTKDKLESYYGMKAECDALQLEIEMLYDNVKAIDYAKNISSTSNGSSQVEQTTFRILALKERLEAKRAKMIELLEEIDLFVDSIENGEIRAIMRYHYLLGNSWYATSFKVFGVYSYDIPRKRIDRFFENQLSEMSDK